MSNNKDISIEKLTDKLDAIDEYLHFLEFGNNQDTHHYEETLEIRQQIENMIEKKRKQCKIKSLFFRFFFNKFN